MDKNSIVALLETNDLAVMRALVILKARQTFDEQKAEDTKYLNGRGFRPCHARMGTSMGRVVENGYRLTEKQIAYWRRRDKAGNMRIGIYWGQLLEEFKKKQSSKETNNVAS